MKINLTTQRLDGYTARIVETVAAVIEDDCYPPPGMIINVGGVRYLTGQIERVVDPTAPSDRVLVSCRCQVLK